MKGIGGNVVREKAAAPAVSDAPDKTLGTVYRNLEGLVFNPSTMGIDLGRQGTRATGCDAVMTGTWQHGTGSVGLAVPRQLSILVQERAETLERL